MFTTYILKSQDGKLYKGVTNDLNRRFREHTSGQTRTTSKMNGLEIVYFEKYDKFEEARKREVYFKTAAGRRFLKKNIRP
jgi:putative endonuclease